jgi:hypothetical protein
VALATEKTCGPYRDKAHEIINSAASSEEKVEQSSKLLYMYTTCSELVGTAVNAYDALQAGDTKLTVKTGYNLGFDFINSKVTFEFKYQGPESPRGWLDSIRCCSL